MILTREATPSDSQQIISFQLKMARETENLELDSTLVARGVQAVFQDNTKGSYYVAEVDGVVAGSLLTTYEWSDWRNGRILWIQSVYVSQEYRGKGIYRKLYEHIKNMVQNHDSGFRGIRLYVDKTNLAAQKVYQKLGMENHHYEMYEWMAD